MKKEDLKRWGKALLIALIVFSILSLYLYIRRGYYNLYIINKVLGSTAVILAGTTLLIGPISKKIILITPFMTVRRHLGLTAFGFAVFHLIASLSQTQRFTWFAWYLKEWLPVLFGFIALFIWIYMAYISRNVKIKQMGSAVWKNKLSIAGKLGFLAIFLHLAIMKYEGWIRWFQGLTKQTPELANPQYPPASLFVFAFMILVIIYRMITYFRHKQKTI